MLNKLKLKQTNFEPAFVSCQQRVFFILFFLLGSQSDVFQMSQRFRKLLLFIIYFLFTPEPLISYLIHQKGPGLDQASVE